MHKNISDVYYDTFIVQVQASKVKWQLEIFRTGLTIKYKGSSQARLTVIGGVLTFNLKYGFYGFPILFVSMLYNCMFQLDLA